MGRHNHLVDGVSCSGKTTVGEELQRRGHHVVHGDRELAYRGDPVTGAPVADGGHEHHLWDVAKVRALLADTTHEVTYFCGGARNHAEFTAAWDGVLVLTVDRATLLRRLDARPADEFGAAPEERALVEELHRTGRDLPEGTPVDATRPVAQVVDEIERLTGTGKPC
ncbi:AAA family ATPase [Quadrisphaera oryzae]|uniref:AAA family ATPase n=1 Tax=Quadrisphaera TaxID=317661 RepID=UPI0016495D66|nr:AAA family ATPase [Quadrisphaera sp. RL12-1S]